ncbi:hypothetical protein F4805DRAFT_425386 [Annulohypoxylon moriforme]|nr:hypothetical protein F4805DRAFT_425386 [Annulohypoxylon moriforme]
MKFIGANILALACVAAATPTLYEAQLSGLVQRENGCRMFNGDAACVASCIGGGLCESYGGDKQWCCKYEGCECTY